MVRGADASLNWQRTRYLFALTSLQAKYDSKRCFSQINRISDRTTS